MQFAFMTEPQAGGTYDELLALARWAEAAGFDAFARADHLLNQEESVAATDALTTLAGLGRDTERIKLTVLVTPVTFRHPAIIAKTAATVDQMSGGRLELGVGAGWMETEHERFGIDLPPLRDRFSILFETLAYLRACFSNQPEGFSGRHFSLTDMDVLPGRTGPLPLIIGGSGPRKTPSLAGRFADEYNMFSCDEETQMARTGVMQQAATDAGRNPADIRLSFVGYPVVGADESEYRDRLGARADTRSMAADEYAAMLTSRTIPHGTAEQVSEAFVDLERRGIGRYYIQVYAPLDEIDIEDVSSVLAAARGV
jgi:alkanesulfonate monooxygenase SsuD/methylene tetrahydromethanopterin reductase-like flavin-dependent oxidoreductase (luciferase family)